MFANLLANNLHAEPYRLTESRYVIYIVVSPHGLFGYIIEFIDNVVSYFGWILLSAKCGFYDVDLFKSIFTN